MKVVQLIYGYHIPDVIQPCLDSVRNFYPNVEIHKFGHVENPIFESDSYRFDLFTQIDDILYIDWDVFIKEPFNLTKNNNPCTEFFHGTPDYGIVYSPFKQFWIDLENERIKRGIKRETYGWIRKLLRDKNINPIVGNFNHLRVTGK